MKHLLVCFLVVMAFYESANADELKSPLTPAELEAMGRLTAPAPTVVHKIQAKPPNIDEFKTLEAKAKAERMLPQSEKPAGGVALKIWQQCEARTVQENWPYRYLQGRLLEKQSLIVPDSCWGADKSCRPQGNQLLIFDVNGKKQSAATALDQNVSINSEYGFCIAVSPMYLRDFYVKNLKLIRE